MKLTLRCDGCRIVIREIDIPLLPESLADALADAVVLCPECKRSLLTLLTRAGRKNAS